MYKKEIKQAKRRGEKAEEGKKDKENTKEKQREKRILKAKLRIIPVSRLKSFLEE